MRPGRKFRIAVFVLLGIWVVVIMVRCVFDTIDMVEGHVTSGRVEVSAGTTLAHVTLQVDGYSSPGCVVYYRISDGDPWLSSALNLPTLAGAGWRVLPARSADCPSGRYLVSSVGGTITGLRADTTYYIQVMSYVDGRT